MRHPLRVAGLILGALRMPHDAIRAWREEYGRRVLNLDFESLSDAPFRASFDLTFENPNIVRTEFSPGFTIRDHELAKDGKDDFGLVIARSRNLYCTQRAREVNLGRCDATLLHVSEVGRVGAPLEFGYLCVMFPRSEFEARGAGASADDSVARRVPPRCEVLRLLRAYVHSLENGRFGAQTEARETIRRHIIDLVTLVITRHAHVGESDLSAVVAARLRTALDYIAEAFDDPELTLTAVARSQGISPRYLQRLIETTGTSFSARVAELRLQRALALLTEAREGKGRISDIALQAGFSDISHFNRLFRSRFGDTPSGVRGKRAARGDR
jgi:AraC-like DNA-binding protein